MLNDEQEAVVLASVLRVLSHCPKEYLESRCATQATADPLDCIIKFADHADSRVRLSIARALFGEFTPEAISCAMMLSKDIDADARDWATFALACELGPDTPEIRDALCERLQDSHDDCRAEALIGLALRHDTRVISTLEIELQSGSVGSLGVEAAEQIAAPELHSLLVQLRSWWDVDLELLERAIDACQP